MLKDVLSSYCIEPSCIYSISDGEPAEGYIGGLEKQEYAHLSSGKSTLKLTVIWIFTHQGHIADLVEYIESSQHRVRGGT